MASTAPIAGLSPIGGHLMSPLDHIFDIYRVQLADETLNTSSSGLANADCRRAQLEVDEAAEGEA